MQSREKMMCKYASRSDDPERKNKHNYFWATHICPRCHKESTDDSWYRSSCFRGTCFTIASQIANRRKKFEWEVKHRQPFHPDWRWMKVYSRVWWKSKERDIL